MRMTAGRIRQPWRKMQEILPGAHAKWVSSWGGPPAVGGPAVAGRHRLALHQRRQDALLHNVLHDALGRAQDPAVRGRLRPAVSVLQPSQGASAAALKAWSAKQCA